MRWCAAWGVLAVMGCAAGVAQSVSPPADAGYVLRGQAGVVRVVGAVSVEGLSRRWNALFAATHPEVKFAFEKADDNGAIDALIFDATPFALTGTVYGGGIAYSDIVKAPPFALRVAHASLEARAKVSPLVVIVNAANPVAKVSVAQLAAMFAKPLRAPVLAQWKQMGVGGEAGQRRIAAAGLPWTDHYASEDRAFGEDVFFRRFAGAPPVDDYRMFRTYAEVVQFVAGDAGAIGIVAANAVQGAAGVKVLPVVEGAFGTAWTADRATIAAGRYPLDRYVYLNLRVQGGKPLDGLARAYAEMVLSAAGQAALADEGEGYIPLSETELAEERAKLQ